MKAVTAYRLSEDNNKFFDGIGDQMNTYLERNEFKPCQKLEIYSHGFIKTPSNEFCTSVMGSHHFIYQRQDKILPASVINDFVKDKIESIFDLEGRKVGRKERKDIKDELMFELLPKAFTKKIQVPCFIKGDKIFIGCSSTKRAEEICSLVRDSMGNLPILPLERISLDELAKSYEEGDIIPLDKIKLVQAKGGATSSHKHIPVFSDEVRTAFDAGMSVEEIAIEYKENFSATYTTSRQLKSLKLSDEIKFEAQDGCETEADLWQATQIILSDVIGEFYG
jgi:recombination associated protein RdgC